MNNPHPLHQLDGCINTFSGIKFDLLHPTPTMINIDDIARGLAHNSHFGGQTPFFFSIAQHSVLVADVCKEKELRMVALLHDASEAYIGDMVKPLKVLVPEYQVIEARIQNVIFEKFGLNYEDMMLIKIYDRKIQELEFNMFYRKCEPFGAMKPWSPEKSLEEFSIAYHDIKKGD